jgi:hypothetical protein
MWVLGTMYTYGVCFLATKSGLNTQLQWQMVDQVLWTWTNFETAADFHEKKSVEVPILPPSSPFSPLPSRLSRSVCSRYLC